MTEPIAIEILPVTYPIMVYLQDTRTGKAGTYGTVGYTDENGQFEDYIWSEGNFACDCNRAAFLYGPDSVEHQDAECGANFIIINRIERLDTGKVVYTEITI